MSHAEDNAGTRRDFLYYATAGAGAVATGAAVWPLVNQMNPSADVQALSSIFVDVSGIEVGTQLTVKWLGKPVFIRRRTPEEIEAFIAGEDYATVADRLLASPRYGEQQARLWMDVVRYSDSNGFDWDEFRPRAWRFRDYLIRSFNADKPFDHLIREELAGDESVQVQPGTPRAPRPTTRTASRPSLVRWARADALPQAASSPATLTPAMARTSAPAPSRTASATTKPASVCRSIRGHIARYHQLKSGQHKTLLSVQPPQIPVRLVDALRRVCHIVKIDSIRHHRRPVPFPAAQHQQSEAGHASRRTVKNIVIPVFDKKSGNTSAVTEFLIHKLVHGNTRSLFHHLIEHPPDSTVGVNRRPTPKSFSCSETMDAPPTLLICGCASA